MKGSKFLMTGIQQFIFGYYDFGYGMTIVSILTCDRRLIIYISRFSLQDPFMKNTHKKRFISGTKK